jgi:hypothetical protein
MNETTRKAMLALLGINDLIEPVHDWLDAEYRYFVGQGYQPDHARVMAAASYTTVFGQKLPPWTPPETPPKEEKL